MMKIILNPAYEHLREYLMDIESHFENEGDEIHHGRNSIRICRAGGLELNVKRYAIPRWPNRLIYSFFRAPKGLRAYRYPQQLLEKGVETPAPIAYIEERKCGLIGRSYFVSLQCPYRRRFYEFGNMPAEQCADIARAFARFTASVHESGIMHLDYSPGNILFDNVDGQWRFSLVDTNRMSFGPVSVRKGCENFARLWGQPDFFRLLADEYAAARGADPAMCRHWIMDARKRFWQRFSRRHKIKYDLKFE